MRGTEAVAQILKAEGVEYLFSYPNHPLIDAAAQLGIRPIIARGEKTLINIADGYTRATNGTRPTVIDNTLDDYGAAYPGFLIMNMRLLTRLSTPVKLWIYSHECGHQFRGPDEETADCFAVQRGRRQGWLSPGGVEEICKFISPAKGDAMHFSGSHRCEYMRQCLMEERIR